LADCSEEVAKAFANLGSGVVVNNDLVFFNVIAMIVYFKFDLMFGVVINESGFLPK